MIKTQSWKRKKRAIIQILKCHKIPFLKRLLVTYKIIIQYHKYISDGELLYRYVKRAAFPEGQEEIPSSIFNDASLSCDWEKFQLVPEDSYHIAEGKEIIVEISIHDSFRNPKNPQKSTVIIKELIQKETEV